MDIGIQLKLFGRKFVRADSFIFFSRNKIFRTFFDRNLCQNYQHTITILEIKKIYPVTWNLSQWQCYSNDIQSIFPTYIFTGELIQKHPRCATEIKTTLTFYREPKTFSESEKTLQVTSNLQSWCQSGWKNISSRHEMILLYLIFTAVTILKTDTTGYIVSQTVIRFCSLLDNITSCKINKNNENDTKNSFCSLIFLWEMHFYKSWLKWK